jgi:hypothetical protein
MVALKIALKVLIITLLLGLTFFIVFIAQMYAPLILWILSFFCVVLTVVLPFVARKRGIRIIAISIFSIIINSNYLFITIFAQSALGIFGYGFGLLIITWLLLFILSEAMATLPSRMHPQQKAIP